LANNNSKPINQESDPWDIVQECVSQADITDLKLIWEYNQEFLRGNHLIYLDTKGKRVIRLTDGTIIPGINKEVSGTINAPKDPHITTLDNSITAKAYSNLPFLIPQVKPATGEDEDQDTAINSTHLLMYYHEANNEEELYKRVIGWLKPAGNAFRKDWWDKTKGDYVYVLDPETGERILDEQGNFILMRDKNGRPMKTGDVNSDINPPQRMLIPGGIAYDEKLPWIGEENAVDVDDIFDTYGVKVEQESNLEDLNSLNATSGYGQIKKTLKNHARVREIYFKPTSKRPLGRLIIACNKQILYDGVWDEALTSRYPDEWHPYTHIGYKRIEGDYWYKSQFEYLIDLQIQLNKTFKQIQDALKRVKGCFLNQEESVDWDSVNWDAEGFVHIEFRQNVTVPPQFIQIQIQIQQLVQHYNSLIQRMNDIAANYEVSRGDNIPGVTSGKQVQALQAANSLQSSPLLEGIANGYLAGCRKKLRMCAVHFEDTGRLISITGQENEAIAFTFTPDQIKSDNIVLANGPWFFMDPQQRMAKVDQLFAMGALGNPQSPATHKRYLWLQGIGGGLEEVTKTYTDDIRMAKAENQLFKEGKLEETDPTLVNQNPMMQEYQAAFQQWQQSKMVYEGAVQALQTGQITEKQMMNSSPPPDPGPEPVKPKIYRMARPYDDDDIHLEVLDQLRKSTWFEKACQANPELREATDYHDQSHRQNKIRKMIPPQLPQQPPPPGGGLNIPAPPPGGIPGQVPGAMGA
jgi:hypothetical protein